MIHPFTFIISYTPDLGMTPVNDFKHCYKGNALRTDSLIQGNYNVSQGVACDFKIF